MFVSKTNGCSADARRPVLVGKRRALATTSAIAILAGGLSGSHLAHAQSAPPAAPAQTAQTPAVEEIVVTGSRIVRNGYEAPTPVTVIGAETLQAQAQPDIADYLAGLPTFAGGRPNVLNVNTNGGEAGIATMSLRALGPTRTLILLDGVRTVGGAEEGYVDGNTLPQQLISRTDVVTGGASATYGSDALAGVVNFILDKTYTGIKGEVSGGMTGYGDAKNWKATVTGGTGFADGKGHFLISAMVEHEDPANGALRAWDNADQIGIMNNPSYTATCGCPQMLVLNPVNRSTAAPGGLITSGPLKGTAFGAGGAPYAFNYGTLNDGTSMYNSTQAAGLNYHLSQELGVDITDQNVFTRVSYDVTDNINIWVQASYAHSNSNTYAIGPLFAGNLTIQGDNAFIPASIKALIAADGVTSFSFGTDNADMDMRAPVLENVRQKNQDNIGADGKFDAFGSAWDWHAYIGSGITRNSADNTRDVYLPNYNLAIDAVVNPKTGQIVCRSTLTNPNNGCVPYNVFGVGVNTQLPINYVLTPDLRDEHYVENVESLGFTGEPFSDWAGPVSLALGVEHRSELSNGFSSQPTGWLNGNYQPTVGHYTVTEGYVETVIPLAKNASWAKALDFNGAIRATDYSVSGYVTTWKLGLNYSPTDDIRFRATQSRDIRAPNLLELFGGQSSSFQNNTQDPFNHNALVTADVLSSGDTNLKPEVASTSQFGFVLTPTFLPGFSASVDYWNIDVKGIIGTQSGPLLLCYEGYQQFCPLFQRVVQNGVALVIEYSQPVNLAREDVKGIDFDATYGFDLADVWKRLDGKMAFHFLATRSLRLYTNGQLTPPTDTIGQIAGSSGTGGLPYFRWNVTASYTNDPIEISLTARGFSSGQINNQYIACTTGCPAATTFNPTISENYMPGAHYFDASLNYNFADDHITVFFNVMNLMGTSPPAEPRTGINGPTYANTNIGLYDYLGRVFRTGVRFQY